LRWFAYLTWLGALVAGGWLTGCSGSLTPTQAVNPAARSVRQAASLPAGVRHLFLSDSVFDLVTIFGRGSSSRSISGFEESQGITTDRHGNLYVANTDANDVEVFASPYRRQAVATLATPGQWPVDVAAAKSGTVAAIIICQASGTRCGAPGSVEFFANEHAKRPCASVSGGTKISRLLWGSFDAAGTLYVAGVENYTTAMIGAIAGGCHANSLKILQPSVSIAFAAGIQVDPQGRIAIVNSLGFSGAPQIDVFAPAKRGSRNLKLLSQNELLDSSVVSSFALSKDGAYLFTAEPHYSLAYPYPTGGSSIAQFVPPPSGGDLIEGVAVTPAELP
jgi:DNA-binding beta-propeller fold protein YncE